MIRDVANPCRHDPGKDDAGHDAGKPDRAPAPSERRDAEEEQDAQDRDAAIHRDQEGTDRNGVSHQVFTHPRGRSSICPRPRIAFSATGRRRVRLALGFGSFPPWILSWIDGEIRCSIAKVAS